MVDFDAWRRRIREDTFSHYHYEMARAIERERNDAAAADAYRRAIAIRPDMTAAHHRLAKLLERLGQGGDAEAVRRQAQAQGAAAVASGLLQEAKEAFDEADEERAVRLLDEAEALHKVDGDPLRSDVLAYFAETCWNRSDVAYANREPAAAHAHFDAGLRFFLLLGTIAADGIGARFARVEHAVAERLQAEERKDEATPHLRSAVAADPGWAATWRSFGYARMAAHDFPAAASAFARNARIEPSFAAMHAHTGLALLQDLQLAAAEEWLRNALAIAPGMAFAHCWLGMALQMQDRLEEAEAAHRQSIALGWPRGHLGLCLIARGKAEEAMPLFQDAAETQPAAAWWHRSGQGLALHAAGKADKALEQHLWAINHEPLDAWPRVNAALALDALGHTDDALRQCRSAWERQPGILRFQNQLRPILAARTAELFALAGVTIPTASKGDTASVPAT